MARRTNILGALKWDIVLIGLVLLIAAGYSVVQNPRLTRAEEESVGGSRPPDRTEGDILLLLPDTPAAQATDYAELDCSYGWFNGLWQEFGSYATALTRDLSPEFLAGRSVVIVPARVAEAMPQNGIRALEGFVREGGQLVVEKPSNAWGTLTGVATSGKVRHATQITSVEGLGVHGPMRRHLPDVPLAGELLRAPPLDHYPSGPVLIEVDGQAGLTVNAVGDGHVFTFLFEFGCSVLAIQQGRPTEGMRFGTGEDAFVPTSARAATEEMLTSKVPYADMLERALYTRLSANRPLPRLWMFPGDSAGALIATFSARDNVRAGLGYADHARREDGISTLFVAPDRLNEVQAQIAEEARAEIGLLWIRGFSRPPVVETVGLGAIRPFAHELTLDDQFTRLNLTLPEDRPLRLSRVEESRFSNHWSQTFEELTSGRIRLDSSFGPTEPEQFGYVFGTGFPFYPIDDRGLPLPLLELPYLLHSSGLSRDRLEDFLENSAAYFNQSITLSLPADAMRDDPSAGILLGYRDAFDLAREHRHWVTSVGDFLDFLSARRRSILTSQWSAEERRLTISVNLLGARAKTLEEGAFPGVAFPRTHAGEEIERLMVDEEEVSLKRLTTTGSSFDRIITLKPGRHTISVFYASSEAEEASDGDDSGEEGDD